LIECGDTLVLFWRACLVAACFFVLIASGWRYWVSREVTSLEMKLLIQGIWWLTLGAGVRSVEAVYHGEVVAWALIPFSVGTVVVTLWLLLPFRQAAKQLAAQDPFGPDEPDPLVDPLDP
jgi:hypothetical protein